MGKRKWVIIAGAITAGTIVLVGLGFGVSTLSAQEPAATPVPQQPWPRERMERSPMAGAARFGWQMRGQIDLIAEVLGMGTEDLMAALGEGRSVAEVAEVQGVALETVVEALLAPQRERIEQAVGEGRLTQEEVDERLAEMAKQITARLQEPMSLRKMGPAGRMWQAERFGWQMRGQIDLIAEALGMGTEDLVAELRAGQSVAEVAEGQGVALETVVEALLAERQEALEQAVAEGRLTQEEADEMLAEMAEQITARLEEALPFDRMRPGGRTGSGWGRRGCDGGDRDRPLPLRAPADLP